MPPDQSLQWQLLENLTVSLFLAVFCHNPSYANASRCARSFRWETETQREREMSTHPKQRHWHYEPRPPDVERALGPFKPCCFFTHRETVMEFHFGRIAEGSRGNRSRDHHWCCTCCMSSPGGTITSAGIAMGQNCLKHLSAIFTLFHNGKSREIDL